MDLSSISKKDIILVAALSAVVVTAIGLDIACIVYVFGVISERVGLFVAATVFNAITIGAGVWLFTQMKKLMSVFSKK